MFRRIICTLVVVVSASNMLAESADPAKWVVAARQHNGHIVLMTPENCADALECDHVVALDVNRAGLLADDQWDALLNLTSAHAVASDDLYLFGFGEAQAALERLPELFVVSSADLLDLVEDVELDNLAVSQSTIWILLRLAKRRVFGTAREHMAARLTAEAFCAECRREQEMWNSPPSFEPKITQKKEEKPAQPAEEVAFVQTLPAPVDTTKEEKPAQAEPVQVTPVQEKTPPAPEAEDTPVSLQLETGCDLRKLAGMIGKFRKVYAKVTKAAQLAAEREAVEIATGQRAPEPVPVLADDWN